MLLATRVLNIQPEGLIHHAADHFLFSHSLGRTETLAFDRLQVSVYAELAISHRVDLLTVQDDLRFALSMP